METADMNMDNYIAEAHSCKGNNHRGSPPCDEIQKSTQVSGPS